VSLRAPLRARCLSMSSSGPVESRSFAEGSRTAAQPVGTLCTFSSEIGFRTHEIAGVSEDPGSGESRFECRLFGVDVRVRALPGKGFKERFESARRRSVGLFGDSRDVGSRLRRSYSGLGREQRARQAAFRGREVGRCSDDGSGRCDASRRSRSYFRSGPRAREDAKSRHSDEAARTSNTAKGT
jgi:hypothetical protein